MQGRAHCRLDGLDIEMSGFAARVEDDLQQLVYFPRDFFWDRFNRFFPWADGAVSCTGRNWQIRSLTSTSRSPSSRKRRHSATSRCALAKLAGEENLWVTVLPFTLRVSR